jgi:hypothetical protein
MRLLRRDSDWRRIWRQRARASCARHAPLVLSIEIIAAERNGAIWRLGGRAIPPGHRGTMSGVCGRGAWDMATRVGIPLNDAVLVLVFGATIGAGVGVSQWLILRAQGISISRWPLASTLGLLIEYPLAIGVIELLIAGSTIGRVGIRRMRWRNGGAHPMAHRATPDCVELASQLTCKMATDRVAWSVTIGLSFQCFGSAHPSLSRDTS